MCHVGVGRAEGFEELEDLLPVLDALGGVDERYVPSVRVVGVEEGRTAPALVDGGKLVSEVVYVAKAGIEA